MEEIAIGWWFLFVFILLIYGLTCFMTIKRKTFTSISIRSPTISIITIIGNFLLSEMIILYKIYYNNAFSPLYFFFRVMMVVSLILRYERILKCCKTYKNSEREDEKYFSRKRYLYQEKYYFKILILCLAIIAILILILFLAKGKNVGVFFRFNLIYNFDDIIEGSSKNIIYKMNTSLWICWNFLEQIVLIFYIFRIFLQNLKEKIKLEILISTIILYIYSFICSICNLYFPEGSTNKNSKLNLFLAIFTILIQFCLLFFHGIFPIILSYHYRTSISYHFSPKLMGNLYLFLANEECYNAFYNYLKKSNNINGLFYLKLYTYIMKYKLNFALNINDENEARNDLNEIYNLYFSEENNSSAHNFIDKSIIDKIRKEYNELENRIIPEIFDHALQYIFNELTKIFNTFQKQSEYSNLYHKIREYSYIHCKMCNMGLINQI